MEVLVERAVHTCVICMPCSWRVVALEMIGVVSTVLRTIYIVRLDLGQRDCVEVTMGRWNLYHAPPQAAICSYLSMSPLLFQLATEIGGYDAAASE